jgi:cell division protein FtsA
MICLLDLGTSKISAILVKNEPNTPKVLAFSSVETSGIKRGSIINISSTAKAVKDCINQIEKQADEKIKELHIGLSGEEISSTNSTGQVKITDREVTFRDIEKSLNMSKTMKVPNDKTLLYAVPSEYLIDGQWY